MAFTLSFFKHQLSGRSWAAAWVVGSAATLGGCVVAPVEDGGAGYGYSSTAVYTNYGYPPPPRVEYRYAAPSSAHVWIGGDWFWTGARYDWRPGRWVPPGYRYVAPPPPPPRGQMPPLRPQVRPSSPPAPQMRPDRRTTPPQVESHRPSPPPSAMPQRPDDGGSQARPERPRPPEAGQGERRARNDDRRAPPHRRDRENERRP